MKKGEWLDLWNGFPDRKPKKQISKNSEPKKITEKKNCDNKKEKIFNKYGGHCAYCGIVLDKSIFTVDHIKPKYLGGSNDIDNLNPCCRRCNSWKKTFSIEEFRQEIIAQPERLIKSSAGIRLAIDFGVIEIKSLAVKPKFYFELTNKMLENL